MQDTDHENSYCSKAPGWLDRREANLTSQALSPLIDKHNILLARHLTLLRLTCSHR